ncbi:MAG: helix-turn-helix domain-containing protein [Flavonifractor plautii]
MNKEGECFPSIKTIAAKCGYGISTVKRALDELVEAGYIIKQARFDERKNGGQTSNLYTLCSDAPQPPVPEQPAESTLPASGEEAAVKPKSVHFCLRLTPTPRGAVRPFPFSGFTPLPMVLKKDRTAKMPPGCCMDWGAVHFCTPLNRTGEQILTDEEINLIARKYF